MKEPDKKKPIFDHTKTADAPVPDRITVRLAVIHEHCCEEPVGVDLTYSYQLATVEQPYRRRLPVDTVWQPLKTQWVEAVSCIIIENPGPPKRQRNPTPEEIAEDAAAVIEFGYDGHPPFLIMPGRMQFLHPSQLAGLRLRCQRGRKEIWLTAMPA
jgi:hypothetical protein